MATQPLKGFGAFDAVLRRGKRTHSGPIVVVVSQSDVAEFTGPLAIGVGISKRVAKRAVMRNRVRRLLRRASVVAVNAHAHELRARKIDTMVCLWRAAPSHPALLHLREVQHHMDAALRKMLHQSSPIS